MADHFSPGMRKWLNQQYAEEREKIGPLLDAALFTAQTLRLQEGHKARERTAIRKSKED